MEYDNESSFGSQGTLVFFKTKKINLPDKQKGLLLNISGTLNGYTVRGLDEKLRYICDEGVKHLIVELKDVMYIHSTAMAILVQYSDKLKSIEGKMALTQLPGKLSEILHMLGLSSHLCLYKTTADAIRDLFCNEVIKGETLHVPQSYTCYRGCAFYKYTTPWHSVAYSTFEHCSFREEALFRNIEECRFIDCNFSNVFSIDLSQNNIQKVPKFILELQQLSRLILSQNALCDIPQELGYLENLVELDLSDNFITGNIPPLPNVKYLNLSNNSIDLEQQRWIKKQLPKCNIQF